MVLLLGPIYHLHDFNERVLALREAIRVAKPGAPILIAFCLQDAPLIIYMFQSENPAEAIKTIGYDHEHAIITNNTGSTIKPDTMSDVNHLIDEICKICPVTKGKRFAQDGLSHIIRGAVNSMSDESFAVWLQYLIASAEKEELMGYSNHIIQILIKM